MRVELIKEQRREIVAAPWTMWDASALLMQRVPPGFVKSEDQDGLKSMGADG